MAGIEAGLQGLQQILSTNKANKPRGYDFRMKEKDPEVMCPTCQYILRDPHLIGCCFEKVCQRCLPIKGQPCSHCNKTRTDGVMVMEDKELTRKVAFLKVSCPKEHEGCEWEGELRQGENHVENDCKYTTKPMKSKYANVDTIDSLPQEQPLPSSKEPPSKSGALIAVEQMYSLSKANKPRGYDFHLIEKDPEVMCPTCQYILRDPHLIGCCGEKVCQRCLPIKGQPCSHCNKTRTDGVMVMEDKELTRKVAFLKVSCPKEHEGCEWEGELRHGENHVENDCKYTTEPMKSKYANMGASINGAINSLPQEQPLPSSKEPPSKSGALIAVEQMYFLGKANKPKGYDFRLIEKDPKVMCPTCQYILRDPHLLGCCFEKVCQRCLPIKGQPCSHCNTTRTDDVMVMEDKELTRDISFLKIYCPKEDKGCEWKGELRDADKHLRNECEYSTEQDFVENEIKLEDVVVKGEPQLGDEPKGPQSVDGPLPATYAKALQDLEVRMNSRFDQLIGEVAKLQRSAQASANEQMVAVRDKEISVLQAKYENQKRELADRERQLKLTSKKMDELQEELEPYRKMSLAKPVSKGEFKELKIVVQSAGYDAGNYCKFIIDEAPLEVDAGRGLNVVILDPINYTVKGIRSFDTWFVPGAIDNFRDFISDEAESFSVICIGVKDEASKCLNDEGKKFIDDLAHRTGKIWKLSHRDSYALIAIKGYPEQSAEVISPKDKSRAAHLVYSLPPGGARKITTYRKQAKETKITRYILEKVVTFKPN